MSALKLADSQLEKTTFLFDITNTTLPSTIFLNPQLNVPRDNSRLVKRIEGIKYRPDELKKLRERGD